MRIIKRLAFFVVVLAAALLTAESTAQAAGAKASEPVLATRAHEARAPLHIVAIGDSITGTGAAAPKGWLKEYARWIGADRVTNLAANGIFAHEIAAMLRYDATWRAAVRSAGLITINAGMNDFFTGRDLYARGPWECRGADGEFCLRRMTARFHTQWNAILAEVRALAPDTPVIALTLYHPLQLFDEHYGWDAGIMPYIAQMNAHVRATPGASVADLSLAYNGPDGRDDPIAMGYILPDAIHATDAGHAAIVALLQDLDPLRDGPRESRIR
jgi:lysophospholipase L1-like esterase